MRTRKHAKWLSQLICATLLAGTIPTTACTATQRNPFKPPSLIPTVTSTLVGLADTGNKTTLKNYLKYTSGPGDIFIYYYNEDGERVKYCDGDIDALNELDPIPLDPVTYTGSAIIDLGHKIDNRYIDSSNISFKIAPGSDYYIDDFILDAEKINQGQWTKGQLELSFSEGALEWNNWDYDLDTFNDNNSGREWSIMGGDGNGVYFIHLEVSGITYKGKVVAPATFTVAVYCYGRSATDIAYSEDSCYTPMNVDSSYTSGIAQERKIRWHWETDNADSTAAGIAYLNDTSVDYYTVIWPIGTDASDITADDVSIILSNASGDSYVLSQETAYGENEYSVMASSEETVIAVTYEQWAFHPVYSNMRITVDKRPHHNAPVKDKGLKAKKDFRVSTVGVNQTQTGGGGVTVDGTKTVYNYYGVIDMEIGEEVTVGYTLSYNDGSETWYYDGSNLTAESDLPTKETCNNWTGICTTSTDYTSVTFSATEDNDLDILNYYGIYIGGGHAVYVGTRSQNMTRTIEINGETLEFTVSTPSVNVDTAMADLLPGYNLSSAASTKWAWTDRYQSGWTLYTPEPTSLPYPELYPFGFTSAEGSNAVYENIPYK